MAPEELMRLAIDKAREGISERQTPFGCAIARMKQVIAVEHNRVLATTDITAHAEITALRAGCHRSGQILLEDAVVATTCEPCPMCLSALHWARVNVVYFGASIADAGAAGFHELRIPAADMVRRGGSRLKIDTGVLAAECRELFAEWKRRPDHRAY